ncbi:hypothetical protein BOTBODRAFT_180091 [Botryobasidium botryosum FD-172 SS1]|uniref:Uncharacterized protein n=1 Tax=Botryobasidium botryosum (strain FD-172 SS1) TaxID=930990 RepID=A0A067M9B1_BOTB1|nr:hypothetical protein BOTBODRAFT_180091 [Botryobasidium botryosum FD-172 SS1]
MRTSPSTILSNLNGPSITENTHIPPPQGSCLALPCLPSEEEAKYYYAGLPSLPTLVARTSTTPWMMPTSTEELKELRPIGSNAPKLKEAWGGSLPSKLKALLDSMEVKWTSLDIIRIRTAFHAPIVLWIGVIPASLPGRDGINAACKCRELLEKYDITDVEVEIRESVATHATGRTSLAVGPRDPRGRRICKFERMDDNQRRLELFLFGDEALKEYLGSMMAQVGREDSIFIAQEKRIKELKGRDDPAANEERREAQAKLDKADRAVTELIAFHEEVSAHWATPENRALGPAPISPPVSASVGSRSEGCTEGSEVDASSLSGNATDRGARILAGKL